MIRKPIIIFLGIFILLVNSYSQDSQKNENLIQIAILLDTSNSMDGLIDQAKSQLWKIVNELAISKKNGVNPKLEVALYEYGNNSIPKSVGYIRMEAPLTTDPDLISEKLFNLKTNGGDEYCGQVIKVCTENLNWSKNSNVLKIIFIAGNEPFTQGVYNYKDSCRLAISKGIIVNTIFCGDFNEGVNTNWKDGALLADGKYMNIDQSQKQVYIKAPQDDEIVTLNNELNKTYIAYGFNGNEKKELQSKQDKNALSLSKESEIQRSVTKASGQYNNSSWDIIDAYKNKSIKIEELKKDELPVEMKNMNDKEKKEFVDKMIEKRKAIQDNINKLSVERTKIH